ncbi:MAG TPA: neutral/alkaline non-lysosomal ceramidase N-terminal domain-containing protein, partial [Candidatus Hydrogenedentes bacterium]|nr:neutral/alkaline non-lysosomal ceramidase N-terminal domain-containing protein [Candidatus Hydrogenedentota bacterium]
METSLFRTGQALCLLLAIFTSGVMGADEMSSALRVGAASVTITPEPGIFLGGYDYNRRATGTHDDLYAKAVVFENGETALALVVLDALSVQPFITQPIAKEASAKVNSALLPPSNVIVQATHTHAAPDLTGIYGPDPTHSGLDMGYVNRVISAASDAVKSAWENRGPSSLYWRQAECRGWVDNDSE